MPPPVASPFNCLQVVGRCLHEHVKFNPRLVALEASIPNLVIEPWHRLIIAFIFSRSASRSRSRGRKRERSASPAREDEPDTKRQKLSPSGGDAAPAPADESSHKED